MSKSFCPIPWNFQAIQNNGIIRVCCQMNMTPSRGTLKKPDGTSYNAKHDFLDDARNAELIKSVRKNMIAGEWPAECTRCKQEEETGLRSRRQFENQTWNFNIEDAKLVTTDDGTIDAKEVPVVYYDLRFGNTCNLACRMCGPEDSHSWYRDWAKLYGNEFQDTHGNVVLEKNNKGRWTTDTYEWHYSESFWKQLESNMHNINFVYMAGGEPLIIDRHFEFLEKCIEKDLAKNIILEYNTNLTSLPESVIKLWNYFKKVRVGASVDGIGSVVEYQRYPVKWKQLEKNIKLLDNLPDNVDPWLACTITNLNVFHIPDFILWKLNQNFKKINIKNEIDTILTSHMCHKPKHSNIRILPIDIKILIQDYYEKSKKKFTSCDLTTQERVYKIMDGIIKYMMSSDESRSIETFVEYTTDLDKIRKQNILKIVPEYERLFKDDYYKK